LVWAVGETAGMGIWSEIVDRASALLAFFPPSPPTYALRQQESGALSLQGAFVRGRARRAEVMQLDTERRRGGGGGETIVAVYVSCSSRSGRKPKTILHSHGNAVDLGIMHSVYCHLSEHLGVNVMGYDYSGYGWSTGKPSVRNTFADIRACWKHLVEEKGTDPRDIVLLGQSVGSGPTCEFAAKLGDDLGGVILHSPLASGVRVLKPTVSDRWPIWLDIYPNFKFVEDICAPTLVMHGNEDRIIHISNAQLLHDRAKNPVPALWLPGYDHQNLDFSPEYLPRLEDFFKNLENKK